MGKLKNIPFIFFLLTQLFLISSCSRKTCRNTATAWEYYEKATVINYPLDGCNWLLKLEDGKKLQPVNLDQKFQKDNLNVRITYEIIKDGMGICMAGEMVTLTKIILSNE